MYLVLQILVKLYKSINCCYRWSYTLQYVLVQYIPFQILNIKLSLVPGTNTYPGDLFLQTIHKTELKQVVT